MVLHYRVPGKYRLWLLLGIIKLMTVPKNQFEVGSNKVLFDPVAKKIITFTTPPCDKCDEDTPAYVQIDLRSVGRCSGCNGSGTEYINIADIGGTYILPQTGNPCKFAQEFTGIYGTVKEYASSNCTTALTGTSNLDRLYIDARELVFSFSLEILTWDSTSPADLYYYVTLTTPSHVGYDCFESETEWRAANDPCTTPVVCEELEYKTTKIF